MDTWLEFTRAGMLTLVESMIGKADLERALMLWIRHQAEFKHSLDADLVGHLLKTIPDTVDYHALQS